MAITQRVIKNAEITHLADSHTMQFGLKVNKHQKKQKFKTTAGEHEVPENPGRSLKPLERKRPFPCYCPSPITNATCLKGVGEVKRRQTLSWNLAMSLILILMAPNLRERLKRAHGLWSSILSQTL
jgi:hypothetical protein